MLNILFQSSKTLPEPIRYNPHRDLAYIYQSLLVKAETITIEDHWEILNEFMDLEDVSPVDLAGAWKSLALFLNAAQEDFQTPVHGLLRKAGWFEVNEAAHVAICAAIGRIMIGAFHTAIQETTRQDTVPALTNEEIALRAEELSKSLVRPWCVRVFRKFWGLTRKTREDTQEVEDKDD